MEEANDNRKVVNRRDGAGGGCWSKNSTRRVGGLRKWRLSQRWWWMSQKAEFRNAPGTRFEGR